MGSFMVKFHKGIQVMGLVRFNPVSDRKTCFTHFHPWSNKKQRFPLVENVILAHIPEKNMVEVFLGVILFPDKGLGF